MPSQKSKLFEKLDSWNVTMISSVATRNMELHLNEAISKGTNLKNFNKTWFKTPVFLKSMAFYGCIVGFDGFCEDIESDDRQELVCFFYFKFALRFFQQYMLHFNCFLIFSIVLLPSSIFSTVRK